MPKYRRKGEDVRVNKGKYGGKLHADILEQCTEEQSRFSNCGEEYPTTTIETIRIDTRTTDTILLDAFEKLNSKSYQIRTNAFNTLCTQLQQAHNPDFLERHYDRLIYNIQKALENNICCEMEAALTLLSLAAIQLPNSNRSVKIFYEPLIAILNDECLRLSTQCAVLNALGILIFSYEVDRHQIYILLSRFKEIFTDKMKKNKITEKVYYKWQRTMWTWMFLLTLKPVYFNKKPFIWSHVLKSIENELQTPVKQLKIGIHVLNLDNSSLRVTYKMLSNVIGCGNITKHLARNENLLTKLSMAQSTESTDFFVRLKGIPTEPPGDTVSSEGDSFFTSIPVCDLEKLSKNLLLATNKSSVDRTKVLDTICKELYSDNFVEDIPRRNEVNQLEAVRMATLTVFQLVQKEHCLCKLSNLFVNSLKDWPASISTNASIFTALAFIELIDSQSNNCPFFEPIMCLFRGIFSGPQSKQYNDHGTDNSSTILRTRALEGWGLLLTICSPDFVYTLIQSKIIDELTELMMNDSDAVLRIVCGQVIALIIELAQLRQNEYFEENMSDTCIVMKNIINDRGSASGNRRKFLNNSLRKVVKYVEDGCDPSFKVRLNHEVHPLKTWSSIFKYQTLFRFVGADKANQVIENDRIRIMIPISISPVPVWQRWHNPQSSLLYKLSRAATKKSKTRQNRLNGRVNGRFYYL